MIKKVVLDNGLTVILNRNKHKNRTTANIYVKCGGLDTKFYVDDELVEIPYGTAHFLEHYLIEESIYGNVGEHFSKEYIEFNGITGNYRTEYYISTVHDFKENFVKLLNLVNTPVFEQTRVDNVKKPVIAEINRKGDVKKLKYFTELFKSVFKREVFNKILGDVKNIENMSYETLKKFHSAYYVPSNQVISITGNFDLDIIDLIKEQYDKFNIKEKKIRKVEIEEDDEVVNKRVEFTSAIKDKSITLNYKINIGKYTPVQKNKIDYYLSYIMNTNFKDKSKFFAKLLNDKLSVFSVQTFCDGELVKDYLLLSICVYTEKFDIVEEMIKNTMDNPVVDEKSFKDNQKTILINMINSLENIDNVTSNYINNFFLYDLEANDDVKFVKSLNVKECKEMFNELNLNNYSIVINKGIED